MSFARYFGLALALLLGGVALSAGMAPMPATAKTLRSADTHGPDYPTVKAVAHMGEVLRQTTGDTLDIEIFHSRQLGEESDTIEMVRLGALDMCRVNLTPLTERVPEVGVLVLPFLFRSEAHLHATLDGPIGQEILDAFAAHGMIGLAFYDSGARSFYTVSGKPIRRLADLKGQRIRIQNSDFMARAIRALGAEPVKMPFGQVLTALKTGIVDGAENNWPSFESTGHYTVAPHYTLSRHSMVPEILLMSKKTWDGLSDMERKAVREAAAASVPRMRALWQERVKAAEAEVKAAGIEIIELEDREAFEQAVAPVYEAVLTDAPLRDLVARIQAVE